MNFYDTYQKYEPIIKNDPFTKVTESRIEKFIYSSDESFDKLVSLLSPLAEKYLELMAKEARKLTLKNFGKVIMLYTPMYLSNYCENRCIYCGFNAESEVERQQLSFDEIEKEAETVAKTGIKHILILTGESRKVSGIEYIKHSVKILKKYFSSICIEIYPLEKSEYAELISSGVDALTVYQEVYDEEIYDKLHISGPKKDYNFRLLTPERAASANMRSINIGALLGLNDWRQEAISLGLHAKYLQDKFPSTEFSISVPRIRPYKGENFKIEKVEDKNIVQLIVALRLFLPRLGITLSTRESEELRDNLIPIGITKISAGSTTKVGGHTICADQKPKSEQFAILDTRNVEEVKKMLLFKGYQPVFKDWQ
ncbi:MAG: 2-iminoacetate synthase ThiH [Candidatus Omnitrophica bacterium]|nr:2-iminoacetate synthase ThiH [Candidatus Omnitrophota bacterium]